MNIRNQETTIGAVVAELPKASEVFSKVGIDFCCGGHRKLAEVIEQQGIDSELVYQELQTLKENREQSYHGGQFTEMSVEALTDYIEDTHHSYLREALPDIADLLATILRVHGMNHKELFEIYKVFGTLKTDLEQHLLKEEAMLFPTMEASIGNEAQIKELAAEIIREHEGAGVLLEKLRALTKDYQVPADTCGTFARTYAMLEELEKDLHQHIHLENNILLKDYDYRSAKTA
jgi:regulator of cell morphogenesis and NO signaling